MKKAIITFYDPLALEDQGKSTVLTFEKGADGKAGADGKDGIDGADGKDGIDGAPGKDASVTNKPYTLAVNGWVYEGGYYKSTITDAEIVDGAYVPVTLANETLAVAVDADIQPSLEFGEGFMKIIAISRPNGNININYTIIT